MHSRLLVLLSALLISFTIVSAQPGKKVAGPPKKAKVMVKPNGKVKVAGPGVPGRVKGAINSGGKGGIKIR
jgi:hypothetical protein